MSVISTSCVTLEFLRDASTLKNFVGQGARQDRHRNRKACTVDRALPHLVTAFGLSVHGATVRQQDTAQLCVKAAAHDLSGSALTSSFRMLEVQPHIGHIDGEPVFVPHFLCQQPNQLAQRLEGRCFSRQVQPLAVSHPHIRFGVEDHLDIESGGLLAKAGVVNVAHSAQFTSARGFGYTGLASQSCGVRDWTPGGYRGIKPHYFRKPCGFAFCGPSFGGLNGAPQGAPVSLRGSPVVQPIQAAALIGLLTAVSSLEPVKEPIHGTSFIGRIRPNHPRSSEYAGYATSPAAGVQALALHHLPEGGVSMANALTPFNFNEHAIRVIQRDSEPWFVAADVCGALGYKNTTQAVADNLDADERYICQIDRGGSLVLINESGLYALVLRSRKPEARKFAKWVTSEVLPAIRKTGSYSAAPAPNALRLLPQPTPETIQKAMEAANAVAAKVQAHVFEQLMANGAEGWLHERFLLSFDLSREGSVPTLRKISNDCYVTSIAQLPQYIANEMFPNTTHLARLGAAVNKRLAECLQFNEQKAIAA